MERVRRRLGHNTTCEDYHLAHLEESKSLHFSRGIECDRNGKWILGLKDYKSFSETEKRYAFASQITDLIEKHVNIIEEVERSYPVRAFNMQNTISTALKDMQKKLDREEEASFWNRTGGADHFLVACHDWAIKLTKNIRSCIRALCNSNATKGFEIGKDTTLPVTYIRSMAALLENLGGKPPSERNILAFFAGGMHGYLRPILLQYWQNKESDMKIFGPMPRDVEGKRKYREHMKSSKYCICAKGYEVHTPRVVELIYYECVPVLNWEAFAILVQEKNIPSLRNILLSIPEEKCLEMLARVKLVQQHFLWHKRPEKYDLFHMILHSVWYNRVFHIKTR
ncbi:putative glycosyltransferase isoform X2 [Gossypium australe]|uniref:Putative glycosyltransferase isoform X2 n=1 Tax=Gossypium australe TaxID=47621 RepID=A0A5B6U534_9ROSI|nr:putative glycosyltransferase isoform X2 [Gossypium australe]